MTELEAKIKECPECLKVQTQGINSWREITPAIRKLYHNYYDVKEEYCPPCKEKNEEEN